MAHERDTVLLVSDSADHYTIDRVADAIARRGARAFRLDSDGFPESLRLTCRLDPAGAHATLRRGETSIDAGRVRAVWMRHLFAHALDESLDPVFRDECQRESRAALLGFFDALHDARWVDPLPLIYAAEEKPLQLRLARALGLRIPRTLITNDPAEARAFFHALSGRMVGKLLTHLSRSMDGSGRFLYTSAIGEEDLDGLESLRHCPMVFQERIEKARELRVVHVNGRLFTGAIDASRSHGGEVDWRLCPPEEAPWQHAELPAPAAEAYRALMKRLNLSFGAADFIITPEGEAVFLEVNPTGEWGMLERDLDLPISEAVADTLLERR
jgi:MvdC family ATP-grasp ribosomal peptide maturase